MIKDVLVHVDSTPAGRERLAYAFDLAASHEARLTGVHVLAPVDVPHYFKPHAVEHVAAILERRASEEAVASKQLFRDVASVRSTQTRWRALEGDMSKHLCEQARCVDLVILGQYESEGTPERHPLYLAEEVVLGAGRPVLVIPEAHNHSFQYRRVLIGWDASREATRAVHDALPLLIQAKPQVTIVTIEEADHLALQSDLTDHLAAHGLSVEASQQYRPHTSIGATLINQLAEQAFDLLVIGAYGHPVWLELLFGGATQSVLMDAPTPILISH